jgi:hypothetical protein
MVKPSCSTTWRFGSHRRSTSRPFTDGDIADAHLPQVVRRRKRLVNNHVSSLDTQPMFPDHFTARGLGALHFERDETGRSCVPVCGSQRVRSPFRAHVVMRCSKFQSEGRASAVVRLARIRDFAEAPLQISFERHKPPTPSALWKGERAGVVRRVHPHNTARGGYYAEPGERVWSPDTPNASWRQVIATRLLVEALRGAS